MCYVNLHFILLLQSLLTWNLGLLTRGSIRLNQDEDNEESHPGQCNNIFRKKTKYRKELGVLSSEFPFHMTNMTQTGVTVLPEIKNTEDFSHSDTKNSKLYTRAPIDDGLLVLQSSVIGSLSSPAYKDIMTENNLRNFNKAAYYDTTDILVDNKSSSNFYNKSSSYIGSESSPLLKTDYLVPFNETLRNDSQKFYSNNRFIRKNIFEDEPSKKIKFLLPNSEKEPMEHSARKKYKRLLNSINSYLHTVYTEREKRQKNNSAEIKSNQKNLDISFDAILDGAAEFLKSFILDLAQNNMSGLGDYASSFSIKELNELPKKVAILHGSFNGLSNSSGLNEERYHENEQYDYEDEHPNENYWDITENSTSKIKLILNNDQMVPVKNSKKHIFLGKFAKENEFKDVHVYSNKNSLDTEEISTLSKNECIFDYIKPIHGYTTSCNLILNDSVSGEIKSEEKANLSRIIDQKLCKLLDKLRAYLNCECFDNISYTTSNYFTPKSSFEQNEGIYTGDLFKNDLITSEPDICMIGNPFTVELASKDQVTPVPEYFDSITEHLSSKDQDIFKQLYSEDIPIKNEKTTETNKLSCDEINAIWNFFKSQSAREEACTQLNCKMPENKIEELKFDSISKNNFHNTSDDVSSKLFKMPSSEQNNECLTITSTADLKKILNERGKNILATKNQHVKGNFKYLQSNIKKTVSNEATTINTSVHEKNGRVIIEKGISEITASDKTFYDDYCSDEEFSTESFFIKNIRRIPIIAITELSQNFYLPINHTLLSKMNSKRRFQEQKNSTFHTRRGKIMSMSSRKNNSFKVNSSHRKYYPMLLEARGPFQDKSSAYQEPRTSRIFRFRYPWKPFQHSKTLTGSEASRNITRFIHAPKSGHMKQCKKHNFSKPFGSYEKFPYLFRNA